MKPPHEVARVAVIGNGLMGQGIAQVFARAGRRVTLIGRNPASLEKAMTTIRGNVAAFVARGLSSGEEAEAVMKRIATSTVIEEADKPIT